MPGKIKVKILAGRNLPVMDRSGDTTDAYVELKFGNITYKTDVCRKSLNPQWNSEWYRFEVDDAELQDEPLQIRLMDHDTYSANDAIGKVYINLNPLLLPGVLPSVKNIWTVEAAMNTTAGSQAPNIPYGYHAQMIHGFVEELVVSDDPEYKWIDKIRTPRASNEARQTLFFKLSGEVQRKIGLKALDLGGNAVIGYLQNFDLEGESGIVARGIGTAVTLVKLHDVLGFPCDSINIEDDDVCVLSASGTAAVINFHNSGQDSDGVVLNKLQQGVPAAAVDSEKSQQKSVVMKAERVDGDVSVVTHSERQNGKICKHSSESNDHEGSCGQSQLRCNLCHLPYSEGSVPFRVNVSKCAICKRAKVPDVMFTTIEVPANIPMTGRGCFIQATVCKSKKDLRGELNAKEISDCLPFLEYELHSLLLNKLKIKGMNAVFGLRLQVSVGERLVIGMAVGTAIYLTALPPPTIPQIASGNSWHNEEQLGEMQKSIVETVKKNREFYRLKPIGVNVCGT
ncbi:Uncharacterized protein KIAA0528-like protein [Acromyrmex echinatior]|uniref:Uncharacterized protein KIAA0528-like protein n=1 Tax=Acromyrmex echinatior TaxID=103372 RepID=F4W8M5_ACREC|nr:Uncharacterized protein KIAA0528-like protein [Acromyrmex echinatior]